jgi:hypothetical protein
MSAAAKKALWKEFIELNDEESPALLKSTATI